MPARDRFVVALYRRTAPPRAALAIPRRLIRMVADRVRRMWAGMEFTPSSGARANGYSRPSSAGATPDQEV